MSAPDFSLLAKRRFAPMFVVQFFGAFNDNVLKYAMLALATYTLFRGQPDHVAKLGYIASALFIRHATPVAREGDDIRHARLGSYRDVLAECLFNGGMILGTVQRIRNRPAAGIPHCADEAVAARNVELCYFQQVNTLKPHLCGSHTELVQRNLVITPSRNRLPDTALTRDR